MCCYFCSVNLLLQHLALQSLFIVIVWLNDSGDWPNRPGSMLLNQFDEGLLNKSFSFSLDDVSHISRILP